MTPHSLLISLVAIHLLIFLHFAYVSTHLFRNYRKQRRALTLSFFFYFGLMALERLAIAFTVYNIAGIADSPELNLWLVFRVVGGLVFIAAILFLQSRLRIARKERHDRRLD